MSRLAALLLALVAPLAVGLAAWMTFTTEEAGAPVTAGPAAATRLADVPLREVPAPDAGSPDARSPAAGSRNGPAGRAPEVSLAGEDAFALSLRRSPRAALVFDLADGRTLWRLEPRRVVPMASLTKIMTALLVVDEARPGEPVRISRTAVDTEGSSVGLLPVGRRVRLETLLNGLLIVSGNDAAVALAEHVAGSESGFVARMNRRAEALGLRCTTFASPHGLEAGNRSCARDLAVLTRLAMREPRISRIAAREYADFSFPVKGGRLYLSGHNPLQREDYPGAIGLKTGYTYAAGRCFVGVARRDGHTLGVVLLNSPDPARQAPKLLDAAFATL